MISSELIPYLLIAPLTAGIGWITNLLGIKMMFYPARFVGYGKYFGWQGIIPRLRVRIIRNLVNISVSRICTPEQVIKVLDTQETHEQIQNLIDPHLDRWIEDILKDDVPMWQRTPDSVRKIIFSEARKLVPEVTQEILRELSGRADEFIDIRDIAEQQVEENPELLNELLLRCASKELSFIIRSGLYFGFPLGCIQAVSWYLFPYAWVLPLFGVFVGAGTNWIALKLVTHPAEPVFIGPFRIQGLYMRRQPVVSDLFAEIFTTNFMCPKAYTNHLWHGPKRDEVLGIVKRQLKNSMDKSMLGKLMKQMKVNEDNYAALEAKSMSMLNGEMSSLIAQPETNRQLMQPVVNLLANEMKALKPKAFQQLLLPAFEQDQYLVVLVGGVLGGAMGFAQLVWLFDAL